MSDWYELSIEASPETVESVSQLFQRYSPRGVVIEHSHSEGERGIIVKTYLSSDEPFREVRTQIDLGIRLLKLIHPLGPLIEKYLKEEDWANEWKKHFSVLHIGKRIVICPTWLKYSPRAEEVMIRLDPGMAFGTGLHPTTRMCLELLERTTKPGMRVLDLGSGTGILASAAVKLGAEQALALDTDPVAVRVARENVSLNQVEKQIDVREGTLNSIDTGLVAGFDIIAANITAKTIVGLAPSMTSSLRPDGLIIASGILDVQVEEVERAFADLDTQIKEVESIDDWRALVLSKAG